MKSFITGGPNSVENPAPRSNTKWLLCRGSGDRAGLSAIVRSPHREHDEDSRQKRKTDAALFTHTGSHKELHLLFFSTARPPSTEKEARQAGGILHPSMFIIRGKSTAGKPPFR